MNLSPVPSPKRGGEREWEEMPQIAFPLQGVRFRIESREKGTGVRFIFNYFRSFPLLTDCCP